MIQAAGGGNDHGSWWQNAALGVGAILGAIGAFLKAKQSWLSSQRNGRQVSMEETLKASPFLQDISARLATLHYQHRRDMEEIREAIQRLEER